MKSHMQLSKTKKKKKTIDLLGVFFTFNYSLLLFKLLGTVSKLAKTIGTFFLKQNPLDLPPIYHNSQVVIVKTQE